MQRTQGISLGCYFLHHLKNAFQDQIGVADLLNLMTTTFFTNLLIWFPQLSSYSMGFNFRSNLLIFEVSVIPS